MRRLILLASVAVWFAASAFGQSSPSPRPLRAFSCVFFRPLLYSVPQQAPPPARANSATGATLEQVLTLLDQKSASFKSLQADFEWDQYQKVVDEHDIQRGVMYFRRVGNNVDVAADIQVPEHKKLLFTGKDVQVYSYRTHQTATYPSKNRDEIESFLALGFGGRGHDLQKNFELRYAGIDTIDGRATYKLELTPKSQKIQGMFRLVILWIDQQTGMSLQQKAMEGQFDYRLARYPFAAMKINPVKLPPDTFRLEGK